LVSGENIARSRVIAYIDGLNLFHGLKDSKLQRVMWLDVQVLAERLLKPHQELVRANYVTSRIVGARIGDRSEFGRRQNAKKARQLALLEALQTKPKLRIHEGRFQLEESKCPSCAYVWPRHVEKKSDVCIATLMLEDHFTDACDEFLLISGDSDLVPPVSVITKARKRVVVAFPPCRASAELRSTASAYFTIGFPNLRVSRLPNRVPLGNGRYADRPQKWVF
jgi:uncharacterized LabA/DUF88 family protein